MKSVNRQPTRLEAVIMLHLKMGDLCIRVDFGVVEIVENLVVDVLPETAFMNRFIWDIFPTESKLVHLYSKSVAIFHPPRH